MGFLDIENEPWHTNEIKKALEKRGLRFYPNGDWEIHGPHTGMDYQVYVGLAGLKNLNADTEDIWVAIYPKAVYEIENSSEWSNPLAEKRILIKHK